MKWEIGKTIILTKAMSEFIIGNKLHYDNSGSRNRFSQVGQEFKILNLNSSRDEILVIFNNVRRYTLKKSVLKFTGIRMAGLLKML